ncbi:MAG: ABC transporter ATP-binding protein [Candidatus Wallbacteria bacterium HGW-Wallbacteria-1]|jgi:ABC-2 type transport system ATP-binding protein|uniref:ABC transporter ATP-binding protein n=1 Tax=Candidatus Wallbacteria bacterium HGW-Wallbacteria-1 TaxID=2013854 RepID=A0A2N1PMF4_9BACT|nr:MAG: ABC transporter ATP-binding protein [Candidatus Wallbacteria bacterium HGW-Wallbacteria-1]
MIKDKIDTDGSEMAALSDPVISIKGLTVDFGNGKGIFGNTLSIPRGSVLGLIGRNGAGKTTLVKSLTGLIRPDRGQISVLGKNPVFQRSEVMASTGFVDEDKALYDWMTIDEILRFSSKFHSEWDEALVHEMVEKAELNPSSRISSLSKGARAEIALILALAHKPELLIMDEPTSGLDILVRHDFLERLIAFACSGNTTVIFSSHILEDVERVCDSVVIMESGKIICHQDLETIRAEYQTRGGKSNGIREIFIDTIKGIFTPRGGVAA